MEAKNMTIRWVKKLHVHSILIFWFRNILPIDTLKGQCVAQPMTRRLLV